MMTGPPASRSFRDPDGSVTVTPDRVLRSVVPSAFGNLQRALRSKPVQRFVSEGAFIESRVLEDSELDDARALLTQERTSAGAPLVIEHPRVAFPSYPYEWCPEMLHAAARLTITLATALHASGLGLKDATPYNVLFRAHRPVFIDAGSLETRDASDPTWLPYAQFVRTFLLPLLMNRYCHISLQQVFFAHRDGLEPETVYKILSRGRRLMPAFLSTVSIPTWLSGRARQRTAIYHRRQEPPEKAAFVLGSTMRHLRKQLDRAAPVSLSSNWSQYMETKSYGEAGFGAKERFVRVALQKGNPSTVLDVGCNTGHFSAIAAEQGAKVVAIDSDPVCVGKAYQRTVTGELSILPLVVDIARPSPAMGWRNDEQPSLIDRFAGRFDLVLMLAVLHHLLVTERIPLSEVLELAAGLTTDLLVMEYVGPEDRMFKALVRGRDNLYAHMTAEWFESACRRRFEVLCREDLESADRKLYLLKKRTR